MIVAMPYRCDGCGAAKREANHWWLVSLCQRSFLGGRFLCLPWDDDEAALPDKFHLCGLACLHKMLDEWSARVKKEIDEAKVQQTPHD